MEQDKKKILIWLTGGVIVLLLIGGIYYGKSSFTNNPRTVEQEEYELKNVASKNYLVKVKEGYNEEVINMSLIDDFIKNVENHKKDEVFIIEYEKNENKKIVTSLKKITYDGEEITVVDYDVSNQKKFTEKSTDKYVKMWKVGDNFGAKIVVTNSPVQPVMEGDILFEYVESNVVEYK